MLTGKPLGEAIEEAIRLKRVSKAAVARHFGIKGPSIYDWLHHGRIGKQHLMGLVAYFSDVVPASYWGIDLQDNAGQPFGASSPPVRLAPAIILRAAQLMREATHRVEGKAVDIESDPELFSELLELATIEATEKDDGEREVWATGGPSGGAVGAESEAEARPAEGTSSRRKNRAKASAPGSRKRRAATSAD